MPKSTSWRDVARERIKLALIEYETECLCSGEAMAVKAWKQRLRQAYPFYERANHPYQVWLSECKVAAEYFELVAAGDAQARHYVRFSENAMQNRKRKPRSKPKPKVIVAPKGQLSLF